MVITKSEPFTVQEIAKLKERFEVYIKTVIDVQKKICVAGVDLHIDGEKLLLQQGGSQADICGGGIDLETRTIDFTALINIRPVHNNSSSEIQSPGLRNKYESLSKYFFRELYE